MRLTIQSSSDSNEYMSSTMLLCTELNEVDPLDISREVTDDVIVAFVFLGERVYYRGCLQVIDIQSCLVLSS